MPLYEYRCAHCGHEIEVLRKVSDPAPVDCPNCQQPALQKKLTAAGFQLKGTGWYVTDFRGGNAAASAPAVATSDKGGGADKPAADKPADAAPAGDKAAAPAGGSSAAGGASAPAASGSSTAPG